MLFSCVKGVVYMGRKLNIKLIPVDYSSIFNILNYKFIKVIYKNVLGEKNIFKIIHQSTPISINNSFLY